MEIWEQEKAMDGNVRNFFHSSSYRGLASIAVASMCAICCIPQHAYSLTTETSVKELLEIQDIDLFKDRFNGLEESIGKSKDAIADGRKFIESFLAQIKAQYGVNLSIDLFRNPVPAPSRLTSSLSHLG